MIFPYISWLVVSTPLKNISQLGWLFPTYGKIKNVPNHQSVSILDSFRIGDSQRIHALPFRWLLHALPACQTWKATCLHHPKVDFSIKKWWNMGVQPSKIGIEMDSWIVDWGRSENGIYYGLLWFFSIRTSITTSHKSGHVSCETDPIWPVEILFWLVVSTYPSEKWWT